MYFRISNFSQVVILLFATMALMISTVRAQIMYDGYEYEVLNKIDTVSENVWVSIYDYKNKIDSVVFEPQNKTGYQTTGHEIRIAA